jgi:molecular chaperone GrpE (heat shock protein)
LYRTSEHPHTLTLQITTTPTPQDPEITALKAEIKKLEQSISANQLKASTIRNEASGFSKDAYVRLAAEADNYKRKNADRGKETGYVEQAKILSSFLPIYDKLVGTSEKYEEAEDESAVKTAKSYSALGGNLMGKFKEVRISRTLRGAKRQRRATYKIF